MSYLQQPNRKSKWRKGLLLCSVLCISSLFYQCKNDEMSAEASLKKMEVEKGFEVKLAASEPLVSAPVAMTFDDRGRMWVVEMNGFMPDTLGTGEDAPSGKIVILEDTDHDGVADNRKIFLDSLQLPRAICLIENGALVAEPPYLWYYEIKGDKAGKKTLVDSTYADDGNVEHQPNGLLRAMDNWIYNAKSSTRYRKVGDQWKKESTHFRGQWGVSQDNSGRLYYNHNSANILGDYFTPGLGSQNPNQKEIAGYNVAVVPDNRVYPAHATPGVNRGYMEGILDSNQRLVNFTAACGPLIYRGNLFGEAYVQNGFVAEPSANLIKRNILKQEDGYIVSGEQAYQGKEFLSSVDERFRPVNLNDGPDGALYVLDMYRGIIQHKTYLTPYLKNEIKERNLTLPLVCGRIYRIVPEGANPVMKTMPQDPQQLVAALADPNGWIRDKAQQMLIDRKNKDVVPALQKALGSSNKLQAVHALWTLEGLHELTTEEVLAAVKSDSWAIRMQGLSVIPSVINKQNSGAYIAALNEKALIGDKRAAPYIGFLVQFIQPLNPKAASDLTQALIKLYANDKYVAGAIVSNLKDKEAAFHTELLKKYPDTNLAINTQLAKVALNKANELLNKDPKVIEARYPKGVLIYKSTCQTCHGPDGNGIKSLAPPLNKSEWVNGNKDKLIPIVLFGLTGPVPVNGHLYTKPEIMADMPGIGATEEFHDKDIAELLNYIRNSWQNKAYKVTESEVTAIRNLYKGRDKAFTVEELSRIN
ncbi:DUF7133 domain-containing protein [Pedobacter antarcticus]|uniref:Dehydrogenase n=2 Tax=Pedobacter antarcticus TaxID=34086 RepID=A0A081PI29_9SPHI|nr:c-type cytochrome [Pedobacter antarcticus]KEQ30352.1 dehydrogenase [Pedobacter antarcticus 4BY]SDM73476.1 Cytochrome c, mono-and diheme variants [Pedobacter antarcticus]